MKHTTFKRVGAFIFVTVFGLTWRGAGLFANAQTATGTPPTTPSVEVAHDDFERELQQFMKEIEKDLKAQKVAKEIDTEDVENAGDNFGDNSVIDGEKADSEIQKEINDEVDLESPESNGEFEHGGNATSTEGDNSQGDSESGSSDGQHATSTTDGSQQNWSDNSGD